MSTENTNTEEQQTENASQETDSKAEETSEQASQTEAQNEEGAESSAEDPAKKIAELQAQIEELKKDALYKAAENDNWRKRMMAQKEEAVAYANANLLSDLLESLDNFDRTLDAAKDIKEAKPIVDGIKMINKSLVSMLENKYELVAYGAKGDEFNPDIHEAIGRVEDEKAKKETLQEVYLKGYKLKDRIIRHAKVMVCVPKN
ncbi:MAG: nucleotide exchange factor GrpE [Treponema sp.]|nr:nucleotide exchange factor GrpE [Treponema sp.]MBQ6056706.1 nucleotide exchange factor GrpE [Treponema sp.]MBR0487002.1 nucleotide exchange factor GrpE [Treponema sp.]MBR4448962.1 nucleotide exchange factor GrpE [Treponema sp.]HAC32004.1 nucleotide exchange factor GrpE [Treponema sp.]